MIEFDESPAQAGTVIKIVGIGGAGGNAINTMIEHGLQAVEYIAANTDMSDLVKSKARNKIQLGPKLTRGLGTGGIADLGERSAEESKEEIRAQLEGADMVFIAAGMGGGTGTGGAPIIAKIARDLGILTLGIVTTPFVFEGQKRMNSARNGIHNLTEFVDTLIVIPNSKLSEIYGELPLVEAFAKADNILFDAAKAVADIISISGLVHIDFADVKTVMQNMGYALMGTGISDGDNRAVLAAKSAINNPLLSDISLHGCQSLLINITAGPDIRMNEFEEVSSVIVNETGSDANIIMGIIINPDLVGKVSVTIIATGLKSTSDKVVDFPQIQPLPVAPPAKPAVAKQTKVEDDIDDIFRVLNINQPNNKDEDSDQAREGHRQVNPRTDLPSFLKALD